MIWSGEFTVEFRDNTLRFSSGQCCVVPVGAEHRGTSTTGAEVILFQAGAVIQAEAPIAVLPISETE